jgi:hypothetical protein
MAFSGPICNPWQTHINLWLFASQCSGFIPIGAASGGTSTWWVQASEVVWKFVPLLSWIWITGCGLREMLPSRVCSTVFPNWNQHLAARVFFFKRDLQRQTTWLMLPLVLGNQAHSHERGFGF